MRAFLVGADVRDAGHLLAVEDSLEELRALADTAGLDVVGEMTQKLDRIEPATFIGKGKVEELKTWQSELGFDVALFDDELSPRHQRNLEQELGEKARVLDRTALILDIFAQHAHTAEGKLQVELAQLEYTLPRLMPVSRAIFRWLCFFSANKRRTSATIDGRIIGASPSVLGLRSSLWKGTSTPPQPDNSTRPKPMTQVHVRQPTACPFY